jgi:Raf kinase inhibitor-like YbhB/YbcL family protein
MGHLRFSTKKINTSIIMLIITLTLISGCAIQSEIQQAINKTKPAEIKQLTITSPAFANNTEIFQKYTCKGIEISPEIDIDGLPQETKSMAIILDDPDAAIQTFTHWLVWNIKPTKIIFENSAPGTQGTNDYGVAFYKGPCPPMGTHHYYFKVYALDTMLDLKEGAEKSQLEKAMKGHIIAEGETVAIFIK